MVLPEIANPGAGYAEAAKGLRQLLQVVDGTAEFPAFAGQLSVDIAEQFRNEWTATTGRGKRTLVWVVDNEAGGARRSITVGSEYRDGWEVTDAAAGVVVLRKGTDKRTVLMFQPVNPPQ